MNGRCNIVMISSSSLKASTTRVSCTLRSTCCPTKNWEMTSFASICEFLQLVGTRYAFLHPSLLRMATTILGFLTFMSSFGCADRCSKMEQSVKRSSRNVRCCVSIKFTNVLENMAYRNLHTYGIQNQCVACYTVLASRECARRHLQYSFCRGYCLTRTSRGSARMPIMCQIGDISFTDSQQSTWHFQTHFLDEYSVVLYA